MQSGCPTPSRQTGRRSPQRRPAILITLALIVVSLLAPSFAPAVVWAQDDAATTSLPAQAQEIVHAINRIRLANGLNSLRAHALLNQAAQNHVNDLIANGIYGHYGSDGSNLRTRVARTGYPSLWVSENWVTSQNVEGAMNWWMNDWIHRVNILDASWDEVGVGVGQVSNGWWVFVTDFANADGKDTSVAVAPQQVAAAAPALVSSVPAGGAEYTVRSGDTLMAIGLRYGVEWQDIAVANNLGEFDILSIGRTLRIPSIATAESVDTSVAEGGLQYTVQSGDTLSAIAARYKISWQDIASANRLGEYTVLQIGMQIRLPGVPEASSPSSAPVAASSAPANTEANGGFVGNAGGIPYTIKSGDTLATIAARNGTTWQELARMNGLSENSFLQIGQTIQLPSAEAANNSGPTSTTASGTRFSNGTAVSSVNLPLPTPTIVITTAILPAPTPRPNAGATTAAAVSSGRTYTVQAGDTVIAIAMRLGVGWKELLAANGLSDNSILSLGQVLVVP